MCSLQIEGELEKDSLAKATYQVRNQKKKKSKTNQNIPKIHDSQRKIFRTCTPSVRSARSCSTTTSRSSTRATPRQRTPSTRALSTRWRSPFQLKYIHILTHIQNAKSKLEIFTFKPLSGYGAEGRTCPAPLAGDGEGDSLWHCSGPDQGIACFAFNHRLRCTHWYRTRPKIKHKEKFQTKEKPKQG